MGDRREAENGAVLTVIKCILLYCVTKTRPESLTVHQNTSMHIFKQLIQNGSMKLHV